MLTITEKSFPEAKPDTFLKLPWEKRIKSRLHVTLEDGRNAGLFLPRGSILRGGDKLLAESGEIIGVLAEEEQLSTVTTDSTLLLARICYHLGNRHVSLEISGDMVCYQHDHVLDDMVKGLGGNVLQQRLPFEPEHGAYSGSGTGHSHGHSH